MSFIAPLWLAAAAVVGAGVLFAHLFSTTVPPQDVLPTVRFIPEGTPLTVLRTRRITDWWLLLLRLLAVALLGLALSGVHGRRSAPSRVVLLDVSRAVGSPAAALDSAVAAAQSGAELIAFDSSATRVSHQQVRALTTRTSTLPTSRSRGSLSAGIVAAHRLLAEAPDGRERTELVIVSPLVREEVDSATTRLLALWGGPVRVVRVSAATDSGRASVEIRADGDDPIAAALASQTGSRSNATVRVVRTLPTLSDSQWAQSTGGALVVWPAADERQVLRARAAADSQSGIATIQQVSIAPFRRELTPRPGRAIVRWTDGEPAATEAALGHGCVREVAIPVDAVGDLALRDSFRGITRSLLQPCGGKADLMPANLETLLPAGERSAQPGRGFGKVVSQARARDAQTPVGGLPLALAIVALGILIVEQFLRDRSRVTA